MADYLPPPELDHDDLSGTTPEQRIAMWLDLLRTCEAFLLAGLRHEVGPNGDVNAAFRKWNEQMIEEHNHKWDKLAERCHASRSAATECRHDS